MIEAQDIPQRGPQGGGHAFGLLYAGLLCAAFIAAPVSLSHASPLSGLDLSKPSRLAGVAELGGEVGQFLAPFPRSLGDSGAAGLIGSARVGRPLVTEMASKGLVLALRPLQRLYKFIMEVPALHDASGVGDSFAGAEIVFCTRGNLDRTVAAAR